MKVESSRWACGMAAAVALCGALAACAVPVTRTTRVYEEPRPRLAQAPVAARYGTVERIEVEDTQVHDSGAGALIGGLTGGVLGHQIGRGAGNAAATVLGAFGGAVVGDRVEKNQDAVQSGRRYRVIVRFDDGAHQAFDYAQIRGLHTGERVKFIHGVLDRA
jgi:outer membrane lipoprotein SlyB